MKINILGAGFAGLACAYYLAQSGHLVTVYSSPQEIGASRIAAGLVHPFAGAHSKLNWRGQEAFSDAEELFKIAESASKKTICLHRGVLRLALSPQQSEDFQKNASLYPFNEWKESHDIPGVAQAPGLWIPQTYTIHAENYLNGLKEACKLLGIQFLHEHLTTLPETPVILASGRSIPHWFPDFKVSMIKGQLLRLEWPFDLPPLPHALNSKAYIIMDQDQKSCWAGATFEKEFIGDAPDLKSAVAEIMPKAIDIIPALEHASILDCQAGIRVATPNHLPLVKELKPGCWVITGLGSKGLLYHAMLGKELAKTFS